MLLRYHMPLQDARARLKWGAPLVSKPATFAMARSAYFFLPARSQHAAYVHESLPDSKTHIRLLKILQGGFNQQVVCQMSTWPAADAPMYDAISYTWGDPDATTTIIINGKQKIVRRNCEYGLQQVSEVSQGWLWLDALSINQDDNEEKGHQVARMGQIYKQAVCVHACVGPHADNSERIFEVVRAQAPILKRMLKEGSSEKTKLFLPRAGRCFKLRSTALEIRTSFLMDAKARSTLLR
jgi:hypothetical protein